VSVETGVTTIPVVS